MSHKSYYSSIKLATSAIKWNLLSARLNRNDKLEVAFSPPKSNILLMESIYKIFISLKLVFSVQFAINASTPSTI